MTKSATALSKQGELSPILIAHIRWVIVLAKLKEIERFDPKQNDSILKIQDIDSGSISHEVEPVNFACLFEGNGSEFQIDKNQWECWFCKGDNSKDKDKKKSLINSIYQCRGFYGLNAPNNPSQRFNKMVGELKKVRKDSSSDYDDRIQSWGDYALELVQINGGWSNIIEIENLNNIKDCRTVVKDKESIVMGNDSNSLIQRILYLDRDRYIQILTTTVGALWPLWFLKQEKIFSVLNNLTDRGKKLKNFRIGGNLPKSNLFIDINTYIGKMSGLPYPFGFADTLLQEDISQDKLKIDELDGQTWPSVAVNTIIKGLRKQDWTPPILFPVRSDTLPTPEDVLENYSIPLIALAESCDIFANIYRRKKEGEPIPIERLKVGVEEGTFGQGLIEKIRLDNPTVIPPYLFSRREMVEVTTSTHSVDMIPSYFPVNIKLQVDKYFNNLSEYDIYNSYKEVGKDLIYKSPSISLASGIFFCRQPKGTELIIDFVAYLQKINLILNHLRPEWASLGKSFEKSRSTNQELEKIEMANVIAEKCLDVAMTTKLCKDGIVNAKTIQDRMTTVGKEMAEAMIPEGGELQKELIRHFEKWAWVQILEFAKYTSIYISSELFGAAK